MDLKAPEERPVRHGNLRRQMVFSAVALCIMAVGVWSLMNLRAPYHPDNFSDVEIHDDTVSRDTTTPWLDISADD